MRQTRERLSDEESKTAFDALIRFKLTGQPRYLRASERPELPSGVLSAPSGGVILDLGAYTGDTATGFLAAYPGLGRIIAVEPEPRNYKKLCASGARVFIAARLPHVFPAKTLHPRVGMRIRILLISFSLHKPRGAGQTVFGGISENDDQ